MSLQIQIRKVGDVTIIDLLGRATIGPGHELLNRQFEELIKGGVKKLLVNLAGVTQMDSSGISAIVRTFVTLQRSGNSMKLLSPVGRVREVLELTRLLTVIPAFDNEAGALASLR